MLIVLRNIARSPTCSDRVCVLCGLEYATSSGISSHRSADTVRIRPMDFPMAIFRIAVLSLLVVRPVENAVLWCNPRLYWFL